MSTKIQWTDVTDNPIYLLREDGSNGGHWCRKRSPGCANCFAENINNSGFFGFASHLPYTGNPPDNLYFDESIVDAWAAMRSPKKHFVCSMTDLFGDWVPREWQFKVLNAAAKAPKQIIQLLTKRPEIMYEVVKEWRHFEGCDRPLENVWLGCSVEDQKRADERNYYMNKINQLGWLTWVSYEPALENVDWIGWEFIRWLVVGGESGSNASPFDIEWARNAIAFGQCVEHLAVFMKQLGRRNNWTMNKMGASWKGDNLDEWPEDLRVHEFPRMEDHPLRQKEGVVLFLTQQEVKA